MPQACYQVNLIDWRKASVLQHQRRFYRLVFFVLISIAIIIWSVEQKIVQLQRSQEEQFAVLQLGIKDNEKKIETFSKSNLENQALLERLTVLDSLQLERDKLIKLMNLISNLVPEGVYVDQIKMDEQQVILKGISDSSSSLTAMLGDFEALSLQPLSEMSNARIHSIVHAQSRLGKTVQSFYISFDFQVPAVDKGDK